MRLSEILAGYDGRSIVHTHQRDDLPLCMSCHEKAARFVEFYDRETSGHPISQATLAAQVVCESPDCETCETTIRIPFHECGDKLKLLEWKHHLRCQRWYDGYFDGDLDLAAHWATLQMCAGVRPLKAPHVPRVRDKSKRHISARLRAYVMERDSFRCRRCGASSRAEGVVLHVDHIIAVSKGGATDEANLQTLCGRCNLGKSDREPHSHDLRS
jgi:hypothetical protein